mgnify:CR=1 FL=1
MATYQQWTQSYAPKVILTYRGVKYNNCLLYTSPSPRDQRGYTLAGYG